MEKDKRKVWIAKNGVMAMILAGTLSFSLMGCSVSETKSEQPSQTPIEEPQNTEDVAGTDAGQEAVTSEEEASNAVETAITLMTDGAESLATASEEAKQTEAYQNAKEQAMDNFDTLFTFLFQGGEINGYTIHDVSDSTIQMAKDALYSLDNYIEQYIPEYKEKAKEKLKSAGAWLYDKSTELGAAITDFGSQWMDDVKEKANQR